MIECVVNVSEGNDTDVLDDLARAGGQFVLDVHSDKDHNRSVFTLAAHERSELEDAVEELARRTVERIDLSTHSGVHPRLGALDVVPFIPLGGYTMEDAEEMRDAFARFAAQELELPCFLYGDGLRDLPTIRREAFRSLAPDTGPRRPHPTAGASAVGARGVLVAYNVWLDTSDEGIARAIASETRGSFVRALGFAVGGVTQVSCNLIAPDRVGPGDVYDTVSLLAARAGVQVSRAELVGLIPERLLAAIPPERWSELDLGQDSTIEARGAGV